MAIMRAIAMGLGLSPSFFDDKMRDSFWVLRLIGYPPLDTQEVRGDSEKGISCGEHTDYGECDSS
jgi:isopenicillin N synthase-like dioxygenase